MGSHLSVTVTDFHINPKHFPPFFPLGVCEGFWWAAVTMTTVGYGDKVPKSIGGRLFAVVWISAGLVILAMFMGIVTASLTSSLGQINNLHGLEVYVINGSAEYQFAVLQSAYVHAQDSYEAVYDSIASGKPKLALVDLYATTQHQDFFNRYKLRVAMVIEQELVYGLVLPQRTQTLQRCLRDYKQSHQFLSYSYIEKYLTQIKIPELGDGTEYFRGSLFGYSVYAMTGLFLLLVVFGFWWQHYWLKRRGEWKEEHDIDIKELELSTMGFYPYSRSHHIQHERSRSTGNPHRKDCMIAQQSVQIQGLIDEYMNYEGSWTRRFELLQGKHRREQVEIFHLDRNGYER